VAREFPTIVDVQSALRFTLEAETAGADLAAAAGVIAPDETWREKLEELTCAHDDRMQKLRALSASLGEVSADSDPGRWHGFYAGAHARVLEAEPATTWPAAAKQMVAVEESIAACHEAFATHAGDALGDRARLFAKAGEQAREAARQLRAMLD
jgi:hypothetical protein